MNLFMMYEEANESAPAGAKLGQDRLRFARESPQLAAHGPTDPWTHMEPKTQATSLCIDIQFEINQSLRLQPSQRLHRPPLANFQAAGFKDRFIVAGGYGSTLASWLSSWR